MFTRKNSDWKMYRNAVLCTAALMAAPLLASARPKATTDQRVEKETIDLQNPAKVDGTTLKPGEYKVVVEGNKVNFERNGKTVVTAPCDWKPMPYKSKYNSTTFSANRVLQEIQFAGSNEALEVM